METRDAYWCGVRVSFQREAGKLEEAAAIADECLAKHPASVDLISEAIKVYPELGRTDRIIEVLEAAHREEPDNGQILDALVQTYEGVGSSDVAESVLRAAVERASQDEQAPPTIIASRWTALGAFLVEHERAEDAISAFAKAIELLGDNAGPTLLLRQAEAMTVAKRYDEALKVIDKTPTEVHGPMLKGRIAFERGQYSDALELLDEAAVLWPDNAPIRYYLARTAEGIGDFGRAIEEYRQAIRPTQRCRRRASASPSSTWPRETCARRRRSSSFNRPRRSRTLRAHACPGGRGGCAIRPGAQPRDPGRPRW